MLDRKEKAMEIKNSKKNYKSDYHCIYSCQYHIIFCPKYRRKVLTGAIEKRLKELILEKQEEHKYKVLEMEVMRDLCPSLARHPS